MSLFKNKYRIASARWQNWDYANAGAYFITICTKDRQHYFGEIHNGTMQKNELGDIVTLEWLKTPALRQDMNLTLGEFVVMPNHFHAIIIIGTNEYNSKDVETQPVETQCIASLPNDTQIHNIASLHNDTETHDIASLHNDTEIHDIASLHNDTEIHDIASLHNDTETRDIASLHNDTETHDIASLHNDTETHNIATLRNQFGPQRKNLSSIIRGFKSAITKYAKINEIDFAWQARFHDRVIRDEKEYHNIANYILNNPENWLNDEFNNTQS